MMTSASPVLVPREDPIGKMIFVIVALGFGLVCFVALLVLIAAVFQGLTNRSKTTIREAPLKAFAAGVVGYVVLGGLAWYLISGALIERLLETEIVPSWLTAGIIVVAVLAVMTLLGAAGMVSFLGERLGMISGRQVSGLRGTIWGTLVAVLAGWFPVVGWGVVTPGLLIFSLGGALLAFAPKLGRKKA